MRGMLKKTAGQRKD